MDGDFRESIEVFLQVVFEIRTSVLAQIIRVVEANRHLEIDWENREMKKKTFKALVGLVTLVFGALAAIDTFYYQQTYYSEALFYDDNWEILSVLYILSLLFVLLGFYLMYESGVLDRYLTQPRTENDEGMKK